MHRLRGVEEGVEERRLGEERARPVQFVLPLEERHVQRGQLHGRVRRLRLRRHGRADVVTVAGVLHRPDLRVAAVEQRPAQSLRGHLHPVDQHVILIPRLPRGERVRPLAARHRVLIQEGLVHRQQGFGEQLRLEHRVRRRRLHRIAQVHRDSHRLRLPAHIHNLEAKVLPAAVGPQVAEQLDEDPADLVVSQDLVLLEIEPQRARLRQTVGDAELRLARSLVLRGHALREQVAVHRLHQPHARGRDGDRLAGVAERLFGPIHLPRRLHGRAGHEVVGLQQGEVVAAVQEILLRREVRRPARQRNARPPDHIRPARLRGEDRPGVRAVVIPLAEMVVGGLRFRPPVVFLPLVGGEGRTVGLDARHGDELAVAPGRTLPVKGGPDLGAQQHHRHGAVGGAPRPVERGGPGAGAQAAEVHARGDVPVLPHRRPAKNLGVLKLPGRRRRGGPPLRALLRGGRGATVRAGRRVDGRGQGLAMPGIQIHPGRGFAILDRHGLRRGLVGEEAAHRQHDGQHEALVPSRVELKFRSRGSTPAPGCGGMRPRIPPGGATQGVGESGAIPCPSGFPRGRGKQHARRVRSPSGRGRCPRGRGKQHAGRVRCPGTRGERQVAGENSPGLHRGAPGGGRNARFHGGGWFGAGLG